MPARLLVIGVDSAEATIIERYAAEGTMPAIAGLIAEGTAVTLGNPLKTLPGAIWPEINSGVSGARLGFYYQPEQIHTGEAVKRPVFAAEVNPERYFWVRAGRAGRRVAAFDMPQTVPADDFSGVQLFEWGVHDRDFATVSRPESVLEDIRARFGEYPVRSCDTHALRDSGYRALLRDLQTGADAKSQILREWLAREDWDLFTACYGETHCVGHQFWHFQDPDHHRFDAAAPHELQTAIHDIYTRIDRGIASLITEAGPDATIMVVASHGIGPYIGGPKLVPEILAKMGLAANEADTEVAERLRAFRRDKSPLALRAKAAAKWLIGPSLVARLRHYAGALPQPFEAATTKVMELPNNRCGAIRLNLKGREPNGCVAPGNEATAILEDLRAVFLGLRHSKTGEPIVEHALTMREAFGPDFHPDLPDMIVAFRTDLGRLEAAGSPQLGRIVAPTFTHLLPRSGDHTDTSRVWMKGPGIPSGERRDGANVLDIAPTILSLLGVRPGPDIEGRPWFADEIPQRRTASGL